MAKILNYGSLNIDYVYEVPHFVTPGESLQSKGRSIFAGGKGLNQSVALARAGGDVYHAGAVGKADGQILINVLTENKINSDFLKQRDEASGHTIIQVDDICMSEYAVLPVFQKGAASLQNKKYTGIVYEAALGSAFTFKFIHKAK